MRIPFRVGCPIRRPRDHRSLASPPGFSQRATSFIASQCQGIHQMPLICSIHKASRARPAAVPRHPGTPPRTAANPQREPQPPGTGFPAGSAVSPARALPLARLLSMKTFHEDTSSDGPITRLSRRRQSRPPRSHSQIRFTQSISTRPEPGPRRDQPRPAATPRNNPVFSECRRVRGPITDATSVPISDRGCRISGGERDRTDDLLLAKQALSQLSYTPVSGIRSQDMGQKFCSLMPDPGVVGQGGFEPPTSRLSSARSNQLSY
jgi:hypothetical protein